jgi:hypothetical protein
MVVLLSVVGQNSAGSKNQLANIITNPKNKTRNGCNFEYFPYRD